MSSWELRKEEEERGGVMIEGTIFVLDGGPSQTNSAECVHLIQGLSDFSLPLCVSNISAFLGTASMIAYP